MRLILNFVIIVVLFCGYASIIGHGLLNEGLHLVLNMVHNLVQLYPIKLIFIWKFIIFKWVDFKISKVSTFNPFFAVIILEKRTKFGLKQPST